MSNEAQKKHGFEGIVVGVIGFVILIVAITQVVYPQVFNVNKTNWDSGTSAIWGLLGIAIAGVAILAAFTMFLGRRK